MSTQASVMNKYAAKYFKDNNVTRVVLARENTIEEIKEIRQYTDIEIETFVHGALCVSYSGQCLMSSMIGKRSGNRGKCAQPCRLEYKLKEDDTILPTDKNFMLSLEDLNTISHVDELIEAGIDSFKIEGRMKRPEYVASVVRAYRKAIDNYYLKQNENMSSYIQDMKQMFNRDFTSGYLFSDKNILIGDYPGNKGIIIGDVIGYNKKFKRVIIKLYDTLYQNDSIVFENIDKGRPVNKIYLKNRLVSHANKNDQVEIEFDYFVNKGKVRKTIDCKTIDKLQKTYEKENIKQSLYFQFTAKVNDNAKLSIKYKDIVIESISEYICEKAINSPTDNDKIIKQLSKLGNTPFYLEKIDINKDDVMIPVSVLNQLRRDCIEELTKRLENRKIHNQSLSNFIIDENHQENEFSVDIYVSDLKQLETVIRYPIRYIYYPYSKDCFKAYEICNKYQKEMVLFIPRINKSKELDKIKKSKIYQEINKVVVNEIGAYAYFNDKERIIGTGLNIYNSYGLSYFKEDVILSLEMSKKEILQLKSNHHIMTLYGKVENMISEYCPITQYYNGLQKKKCGLCYKHKYSLIDRKNEQFDIIMDDMCRMHLLNSKCLYIDKLEYLNTHYLLSFTNEDTQEVNNVMNDYFTYIFNGEKSRYKQNTNYTIAYF
jgi:putative protease